MAAVVAEVARAPGRAAARVPALWPLGLIVVAGGVARFAGLDAQSLWLDEWLTRNHAEMSFHNLLVSLNGTEPHPPLYFVCVWLWSKVFGLGEAGLRSFSAVAGLATIPLAYATARTRLSRRAGLLASALVAFSPFLVWYSQEARPYALLAALCLASLLGTIRIADGGGRGWLWAWAATASLALMTHFFAGFVLLAEVGWLLRSDRSRERLLAIGAVGVVGLLTLGLVARGDANQIAWVHASAPLDKRAGLLPVQFLSGLYDNWDAASDTAIRFVAAVALAALGLLLALVAREARRAVAPFLIVAATSILLPVTLAVVRPSSDYVLPRYLIAAVVPLLIVVAAGLARSRPGIVAGAALTGVFLSMTLSIDLRAELQRPDWRTVGHAIGSARTERAVITNVNVQARPLMVYAQRLQPLYDAGSATWAGDAPARGRVRLRVSEVDYVTPVVLSARAGRAAPAPGFTLAGRRATGGFLILTYRSRRPLETTAGELASGSSRVYGFALAGPLAASVYVQRPGG
jgi:hypothetical protein